MSENVKRDINVHITFISNRDEHTSLLPFISRLYNFYIQGGLKHLSPSCLILIIHLSTKDGFLSNYVRIFSPGVKIIIV